MDSRSGLLVQISLQFVDVASLVVHLGLKLQLVSGDSQETLVMKTESHGRSLQIGIQFQIDFGSIISNLEGVVNGGLSILMPLKLGLSLENLGSDLFNSIRVSDFS